MENSWNKKFTLTENHIKLLRRMFVGWQDCEFGAPEIDPKKPYGNSSVTFDIAEIISEDIKFNEKEDDYILTEEQEKRLTKLHEETKYALQIVLNTGEFKTGNYISVDYGYSWKYVGGSN